jgi:hypothetical protein
VQLKYELPQVEGILICDINSALLTPKLVRALIDGAREREKSRSLVNPAGRGWLHRPTLGAIFVERKTSLGAMVVADVLREDATQMALVDDHDLTQSASSVRFAAHPRPVSVC